VTNVCILFTKGVGKGEGDRIKPMSQGNVAPDNNPWGWGARVLPPYVGLPLLLGFPNKTSVRSVIQNKLKGFKTGWLEATHPKSGLVDRPGLHCPPAQASLSGFCSPLLKTRA